VKRALAFYSLRLLGYKPERGADYTSRCMGCGYFNGEVNAGAEHYGYSCGSTPIPWWDPWAVTWRNLWTRLLRRF
jgi:hypothetical protein